MMIHMNAPGIPKSKEKRSEPIRANMSSMEILAVSNRQRELDIEHENSLKERHQDLEKYIKWNVIKWNNAKTRKIGYSKQVLRRAAAIRLVHPRKRRTNTQISGLRNLIEKKTGGVYGNMFKGLIAEKRKRRHPQRML